MNTDREFERIGRELGGFDEWVGDDEPQE